MICLWEKIFSNYSIVINMSEPLDLKKEQFILAPSLRKPSYLRILRWKDRIHIEIRYVILYSNIISNISMMRVIAASFSFVLSHAIPIYKLVDKVSISFPASRVSLSIVYNGFCSFLEYISHLLRFQIITQEAQKGRRNGPGSFWIMMPYKLIKMQTTETNHAFPLLPNTFFKQNFFKKEQ